MVEVYCWDNRRFSFDVDSLGLLVIDLQHDFLAPDGRTAVRHGGESPFAAILPTVARVLDAAREMGCTIIHTREGYRADGSDVTALKRSMNYVGQDGPNGPFLIRGTKGHDFLEGFTPHEGEIVIDKGGFSAFYRTTLESLLRAREISHLAIMGITTQCCVHSTLRSAVDRGFFCLTLHDCCAAEEQEVHDATMRVIQAENHLFGWISEADTFVDGLMSAHRNGGAFH